MALLQLEGQREGGNERRRKRREGGVEKEREQRTRDGNRPSELIDGPRHLEYIGVRKWL